MSKNPLVSIVIASFEYGRFLEEAIESALAQSVDVEVIVVDDGSSDDSVEIARRHPVEVVVLDRVGVGRVRNHGASLARGRYLLFLDADDRLPPDYVEHCVAALEGAPGHVAYAYTPMDKFGSETGRFESEPFRARRLVVGNYVHVSALIRRESFERVGGFDPTLRLGWEDYDLWLRMLDRGYHGVFVSRTALQYRRHGASRNSLSDEQRAYLRRLFVLRYPRLFWRDFVKQPGALVGTWVSERLAVDRDVPPPPPARPDDPSTPDISVVIVNWNSRDDLAACLRSLAAQTEAGFETLVVDNGSTDGSLELLASEFDWVKVVATGENLGFAEGCNRGIGVAQGTWVATLNNDAEAAPTWIAELRRSVREGNERLGMVQSRILFRGRTDRANSTGVLLFPNSSAKDRHFDAPVTSTSEPAEIFCSSAGAALYRRRMLDETRLASGVFDRTFFMYFEDVDLGWRCRLAGWDAVYAPAATVLHAFHGSSSRRDPNFVPMHCKRNRLRMSLKNGSLRMLARGLPRTIGDVIWIAKVAGLNGLREYGDAAIDGLEQRALVTRRLRLRRRDVEKRWVVTR